MVQSKTDVVRSSDRPIELTCHLSTASKRGFVSLQVIIQHLMFGKNVTAATDSPRIHHQLVPNVLEVESGITAVSIDGIASDYFTLLTI